MALTSDSRDSSRSADEPDYVPFAFDGPRWAAAQGVDFTPLLLLDTNYWIDLSEERKPRAKDVAELIGVLVADGLLICPVSMTLLLEVFKQSDSASRHSCLSLMDAWSRGVFFRFPGFVFKDELRAALGRREMLRNQAYTNLIGAMTLEGELMVPVTSNGPRAESVAEVVWKGLGVLSIVQFLEDEGGLRPAIEHSQQLRAAWDAGAASFTTSEMGGKQREFGEVEFAGMVRAHAPFIEEVFAELIYRNTRDPLDPDVLRVTLSGGDSRAARATLETCPSLVAKAKLFAALRANRRSFSGNDFWDVEHVCGALGYVDAVATDAGMAHIVSTARLPERFNPAIHKSLEELWRWLGELLRSS